MNLETVKEWIINYMKDNERKAKEAKKAKTEENLNLAEAEVKAYSEKAENKDIPEAEKAEAAKNLAEAEAKVKCLKAEIEGINKAEAEKAEAEALAKAEAEKAEAVDKSELEALESAAKDAKTKAVKAALEKAIEDKKAEIESKAEAEKAKIAQAKTALFIEALVYCFPECSGFSSKAVSMKKASTTKASSASADKYTYNDAILDNISDNWETAGKIEKRIEEAGKLEQVKTNSNWAGSCANAFKTLAEAGKIERRTIEKHYEYRKLQH